MADAVIFDLDGTLLDTLEDIAGSMNAVLEEVGRPPRPAERYRLYIGDGVAKLVERALGEGAGDAHLEERCRRRFRSIYEERLLGRTRPYDGIPELLAELGRRGIRRAVLSNKPHEYTQRLVGELLGDSGLWPVLGAREGIPQKPHPQGALEVAAELGLSPRRILYVGDSGTDVRTAMAAGMEPLGVLWGFRDAAELRASGAVRLVARPEEVLECL